jgi:hypothetical protein
MQAQFTVILGSKREAAEKHTPSTQACVTRMHVATAHELFALALLGLLQTQHTNFFVGDPRDDVSLDEAV